MSERSNVLADVTVAMPTADDDPKLVAAAIDAALAAGLAHPLVIVDSSRSDGVRAVAARRAESVRYVAEQHAVSAARNRLLELADTRYVVFLDADALPEPGWAAALRRAFDALPDIAVVGARCVPIWQGRHPRLFATRIAGDYLSLFDLGDAPLDVPRVMGTSYAIDVERCGPAPFPQDVPGRRPSDEVMLCLAAHAAGWRIRYEPRAVVGHHIQAPQSASAAFRPGRASPPGAPAATWRGMMRRVYAAGRESVYGPQHLEPLPRRLSFDDRLFRAMIAPAFVTGQLAARYARMRR